MVLNSLQSTSADQHLLNMQHPEHVRTYSYSEGETKYETPFEKPHSWQRQTGELNPENLSYKQLSTLKMRVFWDTVPGSLGRPTNQWCVLPPSSGWWITPWWWRQLSGYKLCRAGCGLWAFSCTTLVSDNFLATSVLRGSWPFTEFRRIQRK
jgi:hypothetical protein